MAIAQQLQAESTEQNNTSFSQAVTLGAGSNRIFLVAIVAERSTYAAPTSVTYGGNALSLVTDGTQTAENITGSIAGVHFYALKEANLPANGSNTLAVTYSGAAVNYVVGWWILTGVNQGNARDVKVLGQTTTATSITVTLDAGATTDAVVCASYKNDTTGTIAITISGAGVTEDFDVSLATGGARGAAGTDLPAVASGTIACVATVSSTSRRILVGIRLIEAPNVNASTMALTGVPIEGSGTGSVTLAGGPDPEFIGGDVGNTPRNITIDADTNLLVVITTNFAAFASARDVTLDGVSLSVATSANQFVQVHYMFDPPVGTFELDVVDFTNLSEVIQFQFANMDSFESGQQASLANDDYSPSRRAVIVHGISAVSTAHTPVTDTIEVHDAGGDWAGYRIVTAAGTYNVGVTTATDPDYAGAIFLGTVAGAGGDLDLVGVPVAGSGTGSARLTSTMALTGAPVAGSGTGSVRLTSTQALTGVPVAGSGTGSARLTSTQALAGVPVAGSGTAAARLTSSAALTGVPVAGSGSGAARLTSTQALAGVPIEGAGTASARLASTQALAGVPVAGSGTGSVTLTGTLSITGVPVEGAGSGSAELRATLSIIGVPVAGSGTGDVIPVTVLALVGVPVEGAGTGSAELRSTLALVGAAVAGAGSATARLLATQALTGVPVAGSGTGAVALQTSHDLTGVPVEGAGTGAAALRSTMALTGAPIEGSGTGSVPSVAGLNLIGVPVQGAGSGAVRLTSTFQLSGVPLSGSGTAAAKLTAQLEIVGAPIQGAGTGDVTPTAGLNLIGVPVEGAGTGSVALRATLDVTGAPVEGDGAGAARLLGSLSITGAPVEGDGSGAVALRATMALRGAPIAGTGTGSRVNPFFEATLDLVGVGVFGVGTGEVIPAPTGQTQAQVGADPTTVQVGPDAGTVVIGSDGVAVVVSTENGVTVVITEGITNVKVGDS